MNHLPYHLELIQLCDLAEVATSVDDDFQSCLAVVKNMEYHKFSRHSVLQITISDQTIADFSIMYWGTNCEHLRTKLRCGSILIFENIARDNGKRYQTKFPTGKITERTRLHVVSTNLDVSSVNPEIFPRLSLRISKIAVWARQEEVFKLGALTTFCSNLKQAQGKPLFDIDLVFSSDYWNQSGSSNISCKDLDGDEVVLKLTEQRQLLELMEHLHLHPPPASSTNCSDSWRAIIRFTELGRELYAGKIAFIYTTCATSSSLSKIEKCESKDQDIVSHMVFEKELHWNELLNLLSDPYAAARFRGVQLKTKCCLRSVLLPGELTNLRSLFSSEACSGIVTEGELVSLGQCEGKRRRIKKEVRYKPVVFEISQSCNVTDNVISAVAENQALENIIGISASKVVASLKVFEKQAKPEIDKRNYAHTMTDLLSRLISIPLDDPSNKILLEYSIDVEVDENEICLLAATIFVDSLLVL